MLSCLLPLWFFGRDGTNKKRGKSKGGKGTDPYGHGAALSAEPASTSTSIVNRPSENASQLAQTLVSDKQALSHV